MRASLLLIALLGAAAPVSARTVIPLVTFNGAPGTSFEFKQLNDPVMGGVSTGTWSVNASSAAGGFGVMRGEVKDVPSLMAPGSIKAYADGTFADASAAAAGGLQLRVRSPSVGYKGFRVTFAAGTLSPLYACSAGGSIPLSRGCFKAQFDVPAGADFQDVYIPFNTFSDKWSPSTGDQTTKCADDADVCPTADELKAIKRVEVWAEGVDGQVELDVLRIDAVADAAAARAIPSNIQIPVVTFDGAAGTTYTFQQQNDPVMGGQSSGTWVVNGDAAPTYGAMTGEVKDVPFLKAPGFIKATATGAFVDTSRALSGGLKLRVRSRTADYKGFHISFAVGDATRYACGQGGLDPLSRGCFKCRFDVSAGDDFQDIYLPFNTFSDKWSPSTGDPTKTCAEDPDVCPTAKSLQGVKLLELVAEGVNGQVELDVESIVAVADEETMVAIPSNIQIPVVTFDGAAGTTYTFQQQNDPVMGGQSSGTWVVNGDAAPTYGAMTGEVKDVPFLKAPGFIKASAAGAFVDTSRALSGGLKLRVRSRTADYKGFRLGFAVGDATRYACGQGGLDPLSRGCFKRRFDVPAGDDFQDIYLPFNTFSDKWSPNTGDQTKTCAEDPDVCPTAKSLQGVKLLELWAEGVNGQVELDVESIVAVADEETMVAQADVSIPLVTFDGVKGTTHAFKQLNDPVMGGQSSGTWSVEDGVGVMRGEVVNVPKLMAPGFITAAANDKYADASAALAGGLKLRVRSPSADYAGFRVSFAAGTAAPDYACAGGGSIPLSRGCWKAKFTVPAGADFQDVYIPFNAFSDKWSPSTGEQTTTCAEDPDVCPTAKSLAGIQRMQVWAEGVNGKIGLDVESITAVV